MPTRDPKYHATPFFLKEEGKEKDDFEEFLFHHYFPGVELLSVDFKLPMKVTEKSIGIFNDTLRPLLGIPDVIKRVDFPYIYLDFYKENHGLKRHMELFCYYVQYNGSAIRAESAFYEHYFYGKELTDKERAFLEDLRGRKKRLSKRGAKKRKGNGDKIQS